jgi:hypothetical protein
MQTLVCINCVAFNAISAIYILYFNNLLAAYISAIVFTCVMPVVGVGEGIILSIIVINYSTNTQLSAELEQSMKSRIAMIHKLLLLLGTNVGIVITFILTHLLVVAAPETYVNYLLASFVCLTSSVCVICLSRLSIQVVELTKMGIHARKCDLNAKKAIQTGLIMLKDSLKKSSSQSASGLSKSMNSLKSKKGGPSTHNPANHIVYSVPANESGLAKTRMM